MRLHRGVGHADKLNDMLNNGTTALGASIVPLGMYAGYLLLHSGNFWMEVCFLALTGISFFLMVTTLCRYVVNYRRNKELLAESL